MVSSIITPFRWYNKYYQQHRWDIECKSVCDFQLITDTRHLLPFQIKRPPSFALITDWILRPCCNDSESPMLSLSESNFVENWSENSAWVLNQGCAGGMCANTGSGFEDSTTCYNGLTIGQTYTVTFNVSNFSAHGPLELFIQNGATVLNTYTSDGVYTVTFTATGTNFCFGFTGNEPGDIICVDSVQFVQAFSVSETDIVLKEDDLVLFNVGDFDIINYCGADLGGSIAPGCYYSVIKDELGNLFYSEVITVKNFNPTKSPYFILEWYNTCDLTDIVYGRVQGCQFKNRLYLPDAVLTRPTYPFKEEGEEDGNQNFNATFQKWQKIVSLFGYKLPEFIVDALTAIRLHDTIKYYYPLRQKQITIDSAVTIKSVDYDVQYVINDCFANVELKMTLNDQFVDETCCHNLETGCKSCSKTIPGLNIQDPEEYEYSLMQDDPLLPPVLYQYIDNEWTIIGQYISGVWVSSVSAVGDIICDDEKGELEDVGGWQIQNTDLVFAPLITSAVFTTGQNWLFIGNLFLNTYGQIEYSIDGGSNWIPLLPKFTQAELSSGVELNVGITCNCQFLTRIRMFDLNDCEYGYSEEFTTDCQTGSGC